jgi:hypothetical protein
MKQIRFCSNIPTSNLRLDFPGVDGFKHFAKVVGIIGIVDALKFSGEYVVIQSLSQVESIAWHADC